MFKGGKNLTIYEPNMHRVEVEDVKGLEVVFLLSSTVIKDIFFNANREMFNIGNPTVSAAPTAGPKRKNSRPKINGKDKTPPLMSGAAFSNLPVRTNKIPPSQIPPTQPPVQAQQSISRPPPADPRVQWEIDAETERLKKEVEREERARARQEREEQKRIKKMIEAEEKERRKREAEIEKETERLRKEYGVPPPPVHISAPPNLPNRPGYDAPPNSFPQYQSAPHTVPAPYVRPVSTPQYNNGPYGPGPSNYAPRLQQNSPYLQAPGNGTASSSGFFGLGGKKVQKKRSVFF
jgi:hypothetical protein